jgi:hypothetical protein
LATARSKKITVISLQDLVETRLVRERDLFRTEIYADGVVSLREKQTNQLALAAANVKNGSRM